MTLNWSGFDVRVDAFLECYEVSISGPLTLFDFLGQAVNEALSKLTDARRHGL